MSTADIVIRLVLLVVGVSIAGGLFFSGWRMYKRLPPEPPKPKK